MNPGARVTTSLRSKSCNGFLYICKDFEELRKPCFFERFCYILLGTEQLGVFLHAALTRTIHGLERCPAQTEGQPASLRAA